MDIQKVLIVEDDAEIRHFIKTYLEMEGYQIIEACNGKEALNLVHRKKPNLVVTDLMMPEMDGVEFYKIMKENNETKAIPIIVLTVKNSFDDIRYAYLIGVDEYITKPFDPNFLSTKIRELLLSTRKDSSAAHFPHRI